MDAQSPPQFGILFDIDGVVARGNRVITEAVEVFQKLYDENGQLRVPVAFLTNAGNRLRKVKAQQLAEWLGIEIPPEQVVMSSSPLMTFSQFHDKHILACGKGSIKEVAEEVGFTKVTTVMDLRDMFPYLVDAQYKPNPPGTGPEKAFPRFEAVVLFGDPRNWEVCLQLILDVLITNGHLFQARDHDQAPYPNLPIFATNADLMWVTEAHMPRLTHGSFLLCLESLYKKVTGRDLVYTALTGKPSQVIYHHARNTLIEQARAMGLEKQLKTIYAIGDNPLSDIYGANLYNQYLTSKSANVHNTPGSHQPAAVRQGEGMSDLQDGTHTEGSVSLGNAHHPVSELNHHVCESEVVMTEAVDDGLRMESVLVFTGVHSEPDETKPKVKNDLQLDHGHRDFGYNETLVKPAIKAQHVLEAVNIIFNREGLQL